MIAKSASCTCLVDNLLTKITTQLDLNQQALQQVSQILNRYYDSLCNVDRRPNQVTSQSIQQNTSITQLVSELCHRLWLHDIFDKVEFDKLVALLSPKLVGEFKAINVKYGHEVNYKWYCFNDSSDLLVVDAKNGSYKSCKEYQYQKLLDCVVYL